MPVARGPKFTPTRAALFAIVSLVLGFGLVLLVVTFAGNDSIGDLNLGEDTANQGSAEERAATIASDGPYSLPSLANERPVWVQHLGVDAETGWYAFDARSPNRPDECALQWDRETENFFDECAPEDTWPADGAGLLQYKAFVNESGDLIIDLAPDDPEDTDEEP